MTLLRSIIPAFGRATAGDGGVIGHGTQRVMRAMSIPYTAAHGSTRFSLSRDTTEADVDRVLEVLPEIIARLRQLSPYWGKDGPKATPDFAPAYA